MDFTTTEAANDLGNLVDTIVDSVCTPNTNVSSTGSISGSTATCGES